MNLNFSLFLIHIYFNAVEASPDRKKVKISDHEENSFKNHETLAIIDGIDYLGFAKIFSHQSKPLKSSNPIEGAISSDQREISNATGSDSKTYIDEPQLTELDVISIRDHHQHQEHQDQSSRRSLHVASNIC
ncbi:hypothetical protein CWI39_2512p0010, partial [Hamiltosporidium magnivora]